MTSNDEKCPLRIQLIKIAEATFNAKRCEVILKHVLKKLQEDSSKYRKIEKTFRLIEVILEKGSRKVVFELKNKIFLVSNLQEFLHIENKKNVGLKSEFISPRNGKINDPEIGRS